MQFALDYKRGRYQSGCWHLLSWALVRLSLNDITSSVQGRVSVLVCLLFSISS